MFSPEYKRSYFICLKCTSPAFIRILTQPIKSIFMYCPSCGFNQIISIHEYQSHFIQEKKESIIYLLCTKHDKPFLYYCKECNMHLCFYCGKISLGMHNRHRIVVLPKKKINLELIKKNLSKAHDQIEQNLPSLKAQVECSKKVTLIAIDNCIEKNKSILNILDFLLDAYSPKFPHYMILTNIIKNFTMNRTTIRLKQKNLPSFLDNYYIIKKSIKNKITIKTLKSYYSSYTFLFLLSDGRLACCTSDGVINIVDPNNNFVCDMSIQAHSQKIGNMVQLHDGKLASVSDDMSIKIWAIGKSIYKCEYIIQEAHKVVPVKQIINVGNVRMATCAIDRFICIWESQYPYRCIRRIWSGVEAISIVYIRSKDILIESSYMFSMLRVWDLNTYQKTTTILYYPYFSILQIDDSRIIMFALPVRALYVIKLSSFEIEKKYYVKNLVENLTKISDNKVICVKFQEIFIYDLVKNKISSRKPIKSDYKNLIKINDKMLACITNLRKIKIWMI